MSATTTARVEFDVAKSATNLVFVDVRAWKILQPAAVFAAKLTSWVAVSSIIAFEDPNPTFCL